MSVVPQPEESDLTSDQIRYYQEALRSLGRWPSDQVDLLGAISAQTRHAVIAFQQAWNIANGAPDVPAAVLPAGVPALLTINGLLDMKTRAAISVALRRSAVGIQDSSAVERLILERFWREPIPLHLTVRVPVSDSASLPDLGLRVVILEHAQRVSGRGADFVPTQVEIRPIYHEVADPIVGLARRVAYALYALPWSASAVDVVTRDARVPVDLMSTAWQEAGGRYWQNYDGPRPVRTSADAAVIVDSVPVLSRTDPSGSMRTRASGVPVPGYTSLSCQLAGGTFAPGPNGSVVGTCDIPQGGGGGMGNMPRVTIPPGATELWQGQSSTTGNSAALYRAADGKTYYREESPWQGGGTVQREATEQDLALAQGGGGAPQVSTVQLIASIGGIGTALAGSIFGYLASEQRNELQLRLAELQRQQQQAQLAASNDVAAAQLAIQRIQAETQQLVAQATMAANQNALAQGGGSLLTPAQLAQLQALAGGGGVPTWAMVAGGVAVLGLLGGLVYVLTKPQGYAGPYGAPQYAQQPYYPQQGAR